MGKFDGILFCTDLDGTLFKDDKTISEENIKAIEYFKSEGGIFTFITGRMPFFASEVYNVVKPNTYIGCINGGGLYDYVKGDYIWKNVLPKEALELVECIDKKFANVGIQVNTFYKVYFSKENETMVKFRQITGIPNLVKHYNDVTEEMAKILFGSENEDELLAVRDILLSHPLAYKFDFVRSEKTLFEILPKGIKKGAALSKMCEVLGVNPAKTVAIGDYNNDISMFKVAKVGIAVANACEEAKSAADYITVSNEENAIAKVVFDLENGKFL